MDASMKRRSFIINSALALFGFTVLPPATTYQRIWKVTRDTTIVPAQVAPVVLLTPFRYLDSLDSLERLPMPGEISSKLLATLFPMHYAA